MKKVAIKDFCTAFIALAVGIVKDVCFGLWGMFWVWIDEIKKALKEMSALEFAKIVSKAVFYSFCVACWIFIFFGITFVGWAII
jgi:hypothetical protein